MWEQDVMLLNSPRCIASGPVQVLASSRSCTPHLGYAPKDPFAGPTKNFVARLSVLMLQWWVLESSTTMWYLMHWFIMLKVYMTVCLAMPLLLVCWKECPEAPKEHFILASIQHIPSHHHEEGFRTPYLSHIKKEINSHPIFEAPGKVGKSHSKSSSGGLACTALPNYPFICL